MEEISIYIRIVITILGLAYPILLQVTSRLDEKYESIHIVELFDTESAKKWFQGLLIFSLLAILIWSFKFKPLPFFEEYGYVVDNSANLLVLISATLLVISFFIFVNKILTYYTPAKFIIYLIKKHNTNKSNLIYFNALSAIFLNSVKNQNPALSDKISRFYYDEFRTERERQKGKPVVYPDDYYSLVYKAIEELAILPSKKNASLEYRTSGGVWLIGELQDSEISDTTYTWLWRNILIAIQYEQDSMILYHWEKAHQYYTYNLKQVDTVLSDTTHGIVNKEAIEKRKEERKRFLEFHYALGGILLYQRRYKCLYRIFKYTTSQPPQYVLLPNTMSEIFNWYIEFRDPYERKHTWISHKYGFPDQNGLHSDGIIKRWISAYTTVLLLRQYTIIPYLINMEPLAYPTFPETQPEKKEWLNHLDFFRHLAKEALDNKELLDSLRLNFLTNEWCKKENKEHPLDFIDNVISQLKVQYKSDAINLPLDKQKINEFLNTSKSILENKIESLQTINSEFEIDVNFNSWFINSQKMVQDRDAFLENPEVHHLDYDSILATLVKSSIDEGISFSFLKNHNKSYLLKQEHIFEAIRDLGINEDYLIINFGINISHYIDFLKIKNLTKEKYKNIDIVSYHGTRTLTPSLFLIEKSNLPKIIPKEVDEDIIQKYTLVPISEEQNIFGSVLDLNTASDEIRTENSQNKTDGEIRRSVLVSIIMSLEIRWKNNINIVQLIEYSEYRQKGLPNELNEIIRIEK